MHIKTVWHMGQYPSFNLELASEEGRDAFLVLKGCQIKDGPTGPFVSVPSKKNEQTGKYWNHAYLGDKFAAIVLSKAQESMRQATPTPSHDGFKARQLAPAPRQAAPARQASSGFEDMDDDIPFINPMRGAARCLAM